MEVMFILSVSGYRTITTDITGGSALCAWLLFYAILSSHVPVPLSGITLNVPSEWRHTLYLVKELI